MSDSLCRFGFEQVNIEGKLSHVKYIPGRFIRKKYGK